MVKNKLVRNAVAVVVALGGNWNNSSICRKL